MSRTRDYTGYRLSPGDEAALRFVLCRFWDPMICPIVAMLLAEIEALRAELRAAK